MIILKIIGVLLLIILSLLAVAVCIPVYIGIKYDERVTLELKYLFFKFTKEFGGQTSEQIIAEPTLFDRILASISGFFKKARRSFRKLCAEIKILIKRIRRTIQQFVKSKLNYVSKRNPKKKRRSSGKSSKTTVSEQSLFASLREERGFWGAIKFFVDLGKLMGGGLVKMYRGISAKKFLLHVRIAGEDAADTAIKYGEVCSFAFPMLAFLLNNMRSYKQDIEITPDFDSDENRIYFEGEFKAFPVLIIGHVLGAVIKFAFNQIKIMFNNQKKK